MDTIRPYLTLLLPIILIQLVLMVVALLDLIRRPALNGPKWAGVLVVVFINIIGPIVYFIVARKDE